MIRVLVTIKVLVITNLHFILRISNNSLTVVRENNRILEEILRTQMPNSPVVLKEPEGSDDYTEVTYDTEQCLSNHYTAPVTPPALIPIAYVLSTHGTADLLMGAKSGGMARVIETPSSGFHHMPSPRPAAYSPKEVMISFDLEDLRACFQSSNHAVYTSYSCLFLGILNS
ncbi:hypothetical protein Tco_0959623 [Tanacetum coccineum]